jgi:hypothetical protein
LIRNSDEIDFITIAIDSLRTTSTGKRERTEFNGLTC